MPRYDHKKCEDDDDARRMAEGILRDLGYNDVRAGACVFSVQEGPSTEALLKIARHAERIARWAREEIHFQKNPGLLPR